MREVEEGQTLKYTLDLLIDAKRNIRSGPVETAYHPSSVRYLMVAMEVQCQAPHEYC
jgi:hypothetical protein